MLGLRSLVAATLPLTLLLGGGGVGTPGGQGPYEFNFYATGNRWGEQFNIELRGTARVRMHATVGVDGVDVEDIEIAAPEPVSATANLCSLSAAERASAATGAAPTTPFGAAQWSTAGGGQPEAAPAGRLLRVPTLTSRTGETQRLVHWGGGFEHWGMDRYVLKAGAHIKIVLWAQTAVHLAGGNFVISHDIFVAPKTDQEWSAGLAFERDEPLRQQAAAKRDEEQRAAAAASAAARAQIEAEVQHASRSKLSYRCHELDAFDLLDLNNADHKPCFEAQATFGYCARRKSRLEPNLYCQSHGWLEPREQARCVAVQNANVTDMRCINLGYPPIAEVKRCEAFNSARQNDPRCQQLGYPSFATTVAAPSFAIPGFAIPGFAIPAPPVFGAPSFNAPKLPERESNSQARPTRPPPPPRAELQPPKLSENAEWVAGSWIWSGADWEWASGGWRVPESDRTAKHTPIAATMPPPPVQEIPGVPPSRGSVWIAGYWHVGSPWTWVPGRWSTPPQARANWRPTVWVQEGAHVRLDPGQWILGR